MHSRRFSWRGRARQTKVLRKTAKQFAAFCFRRWFAARGANCERLPYSLQLRTPRRGNSDAQRGMRTGIHALPAQHAITCRHSVGLAGKRGIQDFGVAQARRLACATMHAQTMVDLHARQAYATKRFVHAAKRTQRAAPHAARPEQFRKHDRRQREDPRKRAEQHGLIHGAHGIHQFEHGHAAYCGKSKHRRRDPDLRLTRNRALAHRNAQLAAKPINKLAQQIHRTRPAAKGAPTNYTVNRQNRKRPGKAGKSNAFRRNYHLNRSEWIKQIESKQMR